MRPTPIHKPWLTARERAAFIVNCIIAALLVVLVLWLTPGCSFPDEGTGLVGCPSCYRPPRDPGHPIGNHPLPPAESSSEGGGEVETTEGGSSDTGSNDGASSSSDDGSSSSTGEGWDALHCDAACDGLDQMQDAEVGGCICAPECSTDEQCPIAPTHCYYGRCVMDDCAVPSDCPAVGMVCGAWSIWSICMWEGEP